MIIYGEYLKVEMANISMMFHKAALGLWLIDMPLYFKS